MYCTECGKANPGGAKFCAYCGMKLLVGQERKFPAEWETRTEQTKAVQPAEKTGIEQSDAPVSQEPSVPAAGEAPAASEIRTQPHRFGKTLQPLAENPAQPGREGEKCAAPVEIIEDRPLPEETQTESEPPADILPEEQPAAAPEETQADEWIWKPEQGPTKPLEDLWADDEEEGAPVREHRIVFPWQRKKEDVVLTSSGTEEMPERGPVVVRRKRDTHIPPRIIKEVEPENDDLAEEDDEEREDIFFVRPKKRRADDEPIDDDYVNSRVRTILLGIAFSVCLCAAIWLFATNSGAMFLAGFNLSTDAQAYRDLGDTALSSNQIKRAAEAYYKALRLDNDDFDTAMLVGKTQQQIGEYDTAANAYYLCTQLRPQEQEPYRALVKLYEMQNEEEKAAYFRNLGETNAGIEEW